VRACQLGWIRENKNYKSIVRNKRITTITKEMSCSLSRGKKGREKEKKHKREGPRKKWKLTKDIEG